MGQAEIKKAFSLSDFLEGIRELVRTALTGNYWIIAEIASISGKPSGHLYFELVEKRDDEVVAKTRANLWATHRFRIQRVFESVTGETLKTGMKIMLQVSVDFHPVYGFSLTISDIEPSFSLGEMERKRGETISRLKAENLFDLNKQITLPPVIQNLAVISSDQAAGYQDFTEQLSGNPYGYKYHIEFFPAAMQGNQARSSLAGAFAKVDRSKSHFDAVVLIRGGGSVLDLSCFDEFEVASAIANCRHPVLTGIGHERDFTISDMVANSRFKTPTAVAGFLIEKSLEFESRIFNHGDKITKLTKLLLQQKNESLNSGFRNLKSGVTNIKISNEKKLNSFSYLFHRSIREGLILHDFNLKKKNNRLASRTADFFNRKKNLLDQQSQITRLADPALILKRGFSISYVNGKILRNSENLMPGDILETVLFEGKLESVITKTFNNEQKTNL